MYKRKILISLTAAALLTQGNAGAEEKEMPEVLVSGEKLITPTMQASETVYTGSEITAKGIEIQGVKATTSVYGALDMLPGINVESADSNGLGAEMGTVRVRGVKSALGALTVEGVPNYGGNPIGPRDYLYDMENMESISMYKGAMPGDIGTGVGSRGGSLQLKPDWPHEDFGFSFKQSVGTNAYTRTFLRVDPGTLPEVNSKVSGSFSYSGADKWRGTGELGPRLNANLALSQPLGEKADIKIWYNHNDLEQHLYRRLTSADIQNLEANYDKDYNATLTGNPAEDVNYYDYNRGEYQNDDVLAVLKMQVADSLLFTVKPYYSKEDAEILEGASKSSIRKRIRDIKRTGLISEAVWETPSLNTSLGYHFEAVDMHIYSQNYASVGSDFAYRGYGRMASGGTSYINSPYVKLAGSHGMFNWQAGLKYFHFKEADSQGYISGPGPDYALLRTPDLDREASEYDILLPTLAASLQLNDALEMRAGYGRTFIRPYSYMPLVNLYSANRSIFQAQGIDLQDLFDGYDIEESHTVDFGIRYIGDWFDIAPTFFYSAHSNLVTTIYDPRVNLNYSQYVGEVTSYGVDLEMNAYLSDDLSLFFNPTYTSMTYDNDLTYAGKRLESEGNQVVDTPEWLLKTGFIYHPGNFEIVPMLRYLGNRYADLEHKNEVDGAALVDLRMSYTFSELWGAEAVKCSFELNNLFDKEYISSINGYDDTRDGKATFYPGAPFSAMLTLSVTY
ncbi:MAG: TonB-dependent receptor [Candidatus Electrothrix communis]|nr:MAG: TonB-dependent receptor [Candidatus Electrothrix communis]